ncbi:hypothetical protein [Streptomyces flaveolus]|uniref:hypothetical protein n=1 Tax=Streptomyces flaveolus TaxID=67297 RepID=UPI0033E626C8
MTPDTHRVLGQIERGEIRCGRDAARAIAARHMKAYGNAVWGPAKESGTVPVAESSADDAWADALTALSTGGAV